uniref:WAPL domain-containing protein n=1 Tax=Anopheles merus TaxID=30066 RepID=A0A182VLJ5_ANOME
MSKWNKPQGVVVPLESLLKERRKENCPAPRRSAGLVGRWGITSFTSIRSRSYVAEYNNVDLKDATGLDLGTGDSPDSVVNNLLGSNNSEPARPRKFFKSRNTIPPPPPPPPADHLGHHSPYGANAAGGGYGAAGPSDLWGNRANVTTTSPQQQQFYQPLPAAAATPQFSPTGPQSANVGLHTGDAGLGYAMQQQQLLHTLPVTKEKKPGRKKKSLEPADGGGAVGRSKPAASAKPPKKEKEKKEKRPKKAKKEPAAPGAGDQEQQQQQQQQEQPKRNSSRIRNRVVNYNEDEDSNDYGRTVAGRSTGNHQPTLGTPEYGGLGPPATDPSFAGVLEQQQLHQDAHVTTATYQPLAQRPVSSSSSPAGGYHSGGEGRYGAKPSTTTVTTPLPSPGEHRPILLRISKGTSMLISTDSEEVSTNNSTPPTPAPQHHYGHHHHHQPLEAQQQQEQQPEEEDEEEEEEEFDGDLPPRTLLAEATGPTTTTTTVHDSSVDYFKQQQQQQQQPFYNQPVEPFPHNTTTPPAPCGELGAAGGAAGGSGEAAVVAPAPAKSELKIKISLGGKPLISSTTSGAGGTAAPGSTTPGSSSGAAGPTGKGSKSSSSKYNFKKRAIEREKARVSSKRSKVELSDGEQQQQQQHHPLSVSSSTAAKPAAAVLPRPSFPLPGTDTYEVFRTLSSLSGGDDFDSQSSILGSASSDNNTPKHTLAPGEDCQIIHSRGSSDCGSDLELSQNSSTAAAPPSDVYSESENTQDNNSHPQPGGLLRGGPVALAAASTTTTSVAACSSETVPPVELLPAAAAAAAPERVEVLKLNLKNVVPAGARVTRNKMKHSNPADEQQGAEGTEGTAAKQPLLLRVGGRSGRTNRAAASNNNNNNNNVVRGTSTVSEKRTRKQTDTTQAEQPRDEAAVGEPMPPHRSPPAVGTGGEAAVTPEAPAVAPKPSVTRQYSRRKKNVVPPDYLGEPSAPAGPESTSGGGEQRHNGDALGTEQQQQSMSSSTATPTSTVAPSAAAAPAPGQEPSVPPAPMRLVLQKKGTIFKSRPLVGSSDGATDTKKRHVYKHKWDHGNGLLDQDGKAGGDAPGGGGAGASGGVGGGAAGVGVSDGGLLANHHHAYATDGAFDDDVDGDGHEAAGGLVGAGAGGVGGGSGGGGSGGGGGGGSSGPSQLDFDGAFFDGDAPPSAMLSRSKRMKTFGAGGSAGGVQSGGQQGTGGGGEARGAGSMPSYYQYGRPQHAAGDAYDGAAGAFDDDETDGGDDEYGGGGGGAKMRCDRQTKPFYTIVRNVKNSHQMQEIGEFQEMDDDVDYILSALHPDNPISTRCLSALQLATKCMKPAFKMHVRAHGVVTRFFRALSDAHQDPSLGLCTAAIMYVFSQDKLNMDLDRDSLALMLNLLDTDHRLSEGGTAAQQQLQKNRQRVKELCEEIKGAGKGGGCGKHIDTDRVTAGSLAMESLLSLTSQRAGEWFKDELRNLGGIEHLIKTVAECYEQVPDRAADWHEPDVAKLRKIERCLRVLNNVSLFNCANQTFLLEHRAGLLVQILVRLYRQVDRDLPHYPTDDATPKESIGVLLRDLLQPMLHMLITLTHSFDDQARGAHLVGKQPDVINNTMNLLLRIANYVPQRCVFDLHLLALTLLLHLARPSQHNRQQVLRYVDKETNRDGFKALVAYFDQQEEKASHAEEKTNAILDTPSEAAGVEDAETKLIQKAEHHMEHTYMGSHVCMLICQLVMDEPGLEQIARAYLKNGNFKRMVAALSRYYEFLNLTTNADAESTAHKRQTKEAIDYLGQLDGCESAGAARASSGPGGSSSSGSGNSDSKAAAFCQ